MCATPARPGGREPGSPIRLESMTARNAWGYGLATVVEESGVVLDTWYPAPELTAAPAGATLAGAPAELAALAGTDERRGVRTEVVLTSIDLDAPPADAPDAYLRLHLLSHRLVLPHGQNLDGLFGVLANVVWTDHGPCAVDTFATVRLKLRAGGPVTVFSVDKFPRMVDYVVPSGVRIGDADRVRLGAHLASGTTVMHEGFVNFNAGTLGNAMVEGRISAGVVIDDGSDLGGGASIMGTLSGGGREVIRVGKRSLVGAEAGIGISLGDDCIVEAGLYVTAGMRVTVHESEGTRVVKAAELSGADGLLFRRNSVSGAVEVVSRDGSGTVELNEALHAN